MHAAGATVAKKIERVFGDLLGVFDRFLHQMAPANMIGSEKT